MTTTDIPRDLTWQWRQTLDHVMRTSQHGRDVIMQLPKRGEPPPHHSKTLPAATTTTIIPPGLNPTKITITIAAAMIGSTNSA